MRMCLILFSYNTYPENRLIIAANRDEFYSRPTRPLSFWDEDSAVLGGRDLKGSGTWLGVTRTGRFAAITNYREPEVKKQEAPSRGLLVSNYLLEGQSPKAYLKTIDRVKDRYNGFNLLVGDRSALFYYSNRGAGIQQLTAGLYGLSNHLLDTPWPKVEAGKAMFKSLLENSGVIHIGEIFKILRNRSQPPDGMLPDTGVGRSWERILSPMFITSAHYGTRSSAVIIVNSAGKVTFVERSYVPEPAGSMTSSSRQFSFQISGIPDKSSASR